MSDRDLYAGKLGDDCHCGGSAGEREMRYKKPLKLRSRKGMMGGKV